MRRHKGRKESCSISFVSFVYLLFCSYASNPSVAVLFYIVHSSLLFLILSHGFPFYIRFVSLSSRESTAHQSGFSDDALASALSPRPLTSRISLTPLTSLPRSSNGEEYRIVEYRILTRFVFLVLRQRKYLSTTHFSARTPADSI